MNSYLSSTLELWHIQTTCWSECRPKPIMAQHQPCPPSSRLLSDHTHTDNRGNIWLLECRDLTTVWIVVCFPCFQLSCEGPVSVSLVVELCNSYLVCTTQFWVVERGGRYLWGKSPCLDKTPSLSSVWTFLALHSQKPFTKGERLSAGLACMTALFQSPFTLPTLLRLHPQPHPSLTEA